MSSELLPLDLHREMAIEALDGISAQAARGSSFMRHGDDAAAIETYRRIQTICREYATPSMRAIASLKSATFAEAASEYRQQHAAPRFWGAVA